jgi:hypothetical protein
MERRRAIDTDAFSAILKSESRSGDRGRTHYGEGAAYLCVVMLIGASTQLLHVGIVLLVVGGFAIILGMRAAIARAAGKSIEDGLDARAEERRMAPLYKFVSSSFTALGVLLLGVGLLVLIASIF